MITYSVEILLRVPGQKRKQPVKWVDLLSLSMFTFQSKRDAFKFARSLDLYTWRVFVVVHNLPDQTFGERKLIEVRK